MRAKLQYFIKQNHSTVRADIKSAWPCPCRSAPPRRSCGQLLPAPRLQDAHLQHTLGISTAAELTIARTVGANLRHRGRGLAAATGACCSLERACASGRRTLVRATDKVVMRSRTEKIDMIANLLYASWCSARDVCVMQPFCSPKILSMSSGLSASYLPHKHYCTFC